MTVSLRVNLPGAHKVRVRRNDGAGGVSVTVYLYAFRGGPQILRVTAKGDAAADRALEERAGVALEKYEAQRKAGDRHFLAGLITRYLGQLDATNLAERTKRDRRKFLDLARTELGHMELRALEARGARKALIDWRDKYAATPKTADERLGHLATVLQWAHDRGEIAVNPVANFPRIYKVNRAEIIWTPADLAMVKPHCAPELDFAIRLAALTGLRLGDLRRLTWAAVREKAIVLQTGKSRGRRTVVIPILDDLRDLLADIKRHDSEAAAKPSRKLRPKSTTVLNSARRLPWTEPGLESALQRVKRDLEKAEIEKGLEGCPVGHLRWHDLRGTAATNFVRAGLDLHEIATIVGWNKAKVEEIAKRYVTAEEIGLAMVAKLERNKASTDSVKTAVKTA